MPNTLRSVTAPLSHPNMPRNTVDVPNFVGVHTGSTIDVPVFSFGHTGDNWKPCTIFDVVRTSGGYLFWYWDTGKVLAVSSIPTIRDLIVTIINKTHHDGIR